MGWYCETLDSHALSKAVTIITAMTHVGQQTQLAKLHGLQLIPLLTMFDFHYYRRNPVYAPNNLVWDPSEPPAQTLLALEPKSP